MKRLVFLEHRGTINFDARTESRITTSHPMFYEHVLPPCALFFLFSYFIKQAIQLFNFI